MFWPATSISLGWQNLFPLIHSLTQKKTPPPMPVCHTSNVGSDKESSPQQTLSGWPGSWNMANVRLSRDLFHCSCWPEKGTAGPSSQATVTTAETPSGHQVMPQSQSQAPTCYKSPRSVGSNTVQMQQRHQDQDHLSSTCLQPDPGACQSLELSFTTASFWVKQDSSTTQLDSSFCFTEKLA